MANCSCKTPWGKIALLSAGITVALPTAFAAAILIAAPKLAAQSKGKVTSTQFALPTTAASSAPSLRPGQIF